MPDQKRQPLDVEVTCDVRRIGVAQIGRHSVEVEISADRTLVSTGVLEDAVDLRELQQLVREIEEVDRELRKDDVRLGNVSRFRREAERRDTD